MGLLYCLLALFSKANQQMPLSETPKNLSTKSNENISSFQTFFLSASVDLRQTTSHETNGQAKTEDGVQHAPEFLSIVAL